MAQLTVRNLGDRLVQALTERAASRGHSAEEEHRQILEAALHSQELAQHLISIPDVGNDEEFGRLYDPPRPVDQ